MISQDDAELLGRALADLRHHRFGFYGPALRDQLLEHLSTPMTARSYRLLRTIEVAGSTGLSNGQVADLLHCDPARATRQVDELQDQGLVRRRADALDRRRVIVTTTAAGSRLLDEAESLRAAYLREVLAHWPGAEVTILRELLERFNRDVEHHPSLSQTPTSQTPGTRDRFRRLGADRL